MTQQERQAPMELSKVSGFTPFCIAGEMFRLQPRAACRYGLLDSSQLDESSVDPLGMDQPTLANCYSAAVQDLSSLRRSTTGAIQLNSSPPPSAPPQSCEQHRDCVTGPARSLASMGHCAAARFFGGLSLRRGVRCRIHIGRSLTALSGLRFVVRWVNALAGKAHTRSARRTVGDRVERAFA